MEHTLPYGDLEITATAFDLFWRKYSSENHEACQYYGISTKCVQANSTLVEYEVVCDWYPEGDRDGAESRRCALLQFRPLPGDKQKLVYQIYEPSSFDESHLIDWVSALTASSLQRIFILFFDYLRDEGYEGDTSAGGKRKERGMNEETPDKVAKVILYMELRGLKQTKACRLAGCSPKTFRRRCGEEKVQRAKERLERDPAFLEEIKKVRDCRQFR